MTKLDDLLARAKKRSKKIVEWSYDDVKLIRAASSSIFDDDLDQQRCIDKLKKNFSRSEILPLHKNCTIRNYLTSCPGQNEALNFCCDYVDRFHANNGKGFILFSLWNDADGDRR